MRDGLLPKSEFLQETAPIIQIKLKNNEYSFLRDTFEYLPKTGELIRLKSFHKHRIGKNAIRNSPNGKDNDVVFIGRKFFCAWKVIYYLKKGVYLSNNYVCKYLDDDKHNHKAGNMQVITRSDRMHLINNFDNFGVFSVKNNNKYVVKIKKGNLSGEYLGSFDDARHARIAYMNAKLQIRNQIKFREIL